MVRRNVLTLATTLALTAVVCHAMIVATVLAEEPAASPATRPAIGNVVRQLTQADFQDQLGRERAAGLKADDLASIKTIARDRENTPVLRLRATIVACELDNAFRVAANDILAEVARRALAAAVAHLERNLTDQTIGKFSPQLGITHITVGRRDNDADHIWVLVESIELERRGGLNIAVDPKTWSVQDVQQWGKVNVAPLPAGRPAGGDQPALSSKPVEKDGLQVKVTLAKATVAAGEQPQFTVRFKNCSDRTFGLYDVVWFWDWKIRFEVPDGTGTMSGSWRLRLLAHAKRQPGVFNCKPGETVTADVNPGAANQLPFDFEWQGAEAQPQAPLKQLRPGKYRLILEIPLKMGPGGVVPTYWVGDIVTAPVEFEVTDKPAARTAVE